MDQRLTRYQTDAERQRFNDSVVKPFYKEEEDYDWVAVTDTIRGPETFMHRFRQWMLLRTLKRHSAGSPMLDVGCGTGLHLRHLPPGSVGIDLNPRNIERARRYAPHAKLDLGDAEHLPYADASFATVICTEVLEHLVYAGKATSEIFRVLKPGGVFIGSVPRDSLLWRLRAVSRTCPVEEPFHNEMGRADLAKLLAPFSDVRIHLAPWLMHYFFVARRPA